MDDGFFVRYPLVNRILSRMLDIVDDSPRMRPDGICLVADATNGKSHTLRKFVTEVQAHYGPGQGGSEIPVLMIDAPVNGVAKDMMGSLARELRVPLPPRTSNKSVPHQIMEAMEWAKVRAICVDEVHHILPGGPHRQRVILDYLKSFGNELMIPVFLAGTAHAHHLISRDDQYHERFPPVGLPRWDLDRGFIKLLRAIEEHWGVADGSFANREAGELIWKHSRGLIGRVFRICEKAQKNAKLSPSGLITVQEINSAGYADLPWLGQLDQKGRGTDS
jgi:hypothetical protein